MRFVSLIPPFVLLAAAPIEAREYLKQERASGRRYDNALEISLPLQRSSGALYWIKL
jgi:hypothetical protein